MRREQWRHPARYRVHPDSPEGNLSGNRNVVSSPPVEESRVAGRWSFFTTLRILKTTPALRATPPPEGNLVRDKKQARHRRVSLLSALCALLSLTRTSRRGNHHCMGGPIFHLLIFSQHHDPTRPTHAHQFAPGIYRP